MLLAFATGQLPQTHAEERGPDSLRRSVAELPRLDDRQKLALLAELRPLGPDAVFATEPLLQIWRQSDGLSDDDLLAAVLDVFRGMGEAGAPASESLSDFLRHECKIYWDRDQLEIIRLRSYLMVTLGEIGLPSAAHPHLLDSLAHSDDRVVAIELGSAARALRSTGQGTRGFIPYLLELVPKTLAEEEFSLARYSVDFPSSEATTAQLEALRALSVLCYPDDEEALGLLRRLASVPDDSRWDPRAVDEAKRALAAIRTKERARATSAPRLPPSPRKIESSRSWVTEGDRRPIAELDISYTNQEGQRGVLRELVDRPAVITFFYTRCQNDYKCSAALTRLASLQTALKRFGLAEKVRLIAITYEPAYDDPSRLKRFGSNRGLEFTATAQALRLNEAKHESLVKALEAPVSFNGGAVNTHGVGLHVLDAEGRVARRYHTLLWDNGRVVHDLRKLLGDL